MGLPVAGFDGSIGNGVAAMDHHSVAHIDTHMGSTACVIGALKEDQISGLCGAAGNDIADVHQTAGGQSADTPSVSAIIDDPTDEAGAVEGCGGVAAAPHIRINAYDTLHQKKSGKNILHRAYRLCE